MEQRSSTDMVVCPECGAVAAVEWRDMAGSTAGPVEHVKIHCLAGHRFLMLAERLSPVPDASPDARPERRVVAQVG